MGIHRWPENSPHKGQVTRKCFYLMTSSCNFTIRRWRGVDWKGNTIPRHTHNNSPEQSAWLQYILISWRHCQNTELIKEICLEITIDGRLLKWQLGNQDIQNENGRHSRNHALWYNWRSCWFIQRDTNQQWQEPYQDIGESRPRSSEMDTIILFRHCLCWRRVISKHFLTSRWWARVARNCMMELNEHLPVYYLWFHVLAIITHCPFDIKVVTDNCSHNSHYSDVKMSMMASQITCITVVYSTVYPGADQKENI